MPRYVAFLRAINVGGHAVIRMSDLRDMVASFGYSDVQTYIQTGNVLLTSLKRSPAAVQEDLQKRLRGAGLDVTVFVRTPQQLQAAARKNPFRPDGSDVQSHLMFLDDRPAPDAIARLMSMAGDEYRFHVERDVFYYAYGKTWAGKRRSIDFEKVLGVRGTARTWKVVDRLIEMSRPETSP